jgi:hypothetical protein
MVASDVANVGKQTDARREACSDNGSMILGDVNFYLASERSVFQSFVSDSRDYIFISYVNGYLRLPTHSPQGPSRFTCWQNVFHFLPVLVYSKIQAYDTVLSVFLFPLNIFSWNLVWSSNH